MRKLCVLVTDSMKIYSDKGEIKPRYYNPLDYFDEVHIISFSNKEIEPQRIQLVAGRASFIIYAIGKGSVINICWLIMRVCQIVKSIKPDFIRAYDPSLRGALAVWLGKKFKIPAIISIHTEPDEQRRFDKRPLLFLRKIFEDYSIKNADYVLCVSEYVARYAKKHKAKRIEILHNKVSIAAFCNCNTGKIFRRKTILSVGRLEKPKRQDYLIKAMQNIDMDLVLIGDGSLLHRLKKLAEDMGVQEKIFFIRSVAHEEIHRYYLCCEFFAIATDFEGFCIPVIEAMAAGKPIVASDIPAIRELLDSAGVLVENSEVAFSEALNNLITDTETAKALAHKARERAIMFDSPLLEKKEKEIYEKFFKG